MPRNDDGFIDFRLGLSGPAWAILHALEKEPTFAPYDDENGYEVDCETAAFYNGRECGFSLRFNHPNRVGSYLYVCFARHKSSDSIIIYHWKGPRCSINPPAVGDFPSSAWDDAIRANSVEEAVRRIWDMAQDFLDTQDKLSTVETVLET